MSEETAAWLIRQRHQRGWDRPEMARQLIKAAATAGLHSLSG